MEKKVSIQFHAGLLTFLIVSLLAVSPVWGQQIVTDSTIQVFVDGWLNAWQAQELDDYFGYYHEDYQPANFATIEAWRQNRRRNISAPERILIDRETIDLVSAGDDSLTIHFNFTYRSPVYADRTLKELVLATSNGLITGILSESNLNVEKLPGEMLSPDSVESPVISASNGEAISTDEPAAESDSTSVGPGEQTETIDGQQAIDAIIPIAEITTPASQGEAQVRLVEPVQQSNVSRADWVPPGFENLNQPQVTEIDVYYGGYFLTSVLAEFTIQDVTILDTETLVGQLGNLKNPEAVQALLGSPLDAHNELLCYSEFQSDCGTLETDSIEVIFDRSLLRLWLFISPDLLEDADANVIRFLPPSNAGLSFMNQSAVYFSTQELSVNTYNLFNNTLFAWGENRLSMRSNLVSDKGFDIDTVAFFREFQGKDYHAGLVREDANGFSFMSNERFAGASFASSLLTRTDLERSLGNEIELYFSTRSRVEIYREGRLISSGYYDVGNHLLETSDLPNGSYTIEIRIIDAAGNQTTEERFYSKTANIPPADQSLFFLHAGRLENDLDINRLSRTGQNEVMVRGGFSKRLGHTLGGSIGFSVVEDTQFVEMGLFKQGQNYEFQANAAFENTGASGLDLRFRYRHPRYNLTINGRQVFNGLQESQIGQDYQQYNATLEIPARSGYYSFFHRHVERPQFGKTLNSGFRFRSHNKELFGGVFGNNFEVSKNGDEVLALWNFNWFMQDEGRTSMYSPTLAYANKHASRDSGLYGTYESNWYRGQQGGNEYNYSLRGDYDSQSSLEARMEADTQLGSADITGRYNDANNQVEMNGRISTSFATTGKASAIGGKRRSESAFLVRVDGDIDADARFNVLVNGSVRGQLGADETLLIPVSPYYTYDVELKAEGDTLVSLDNRIYRETMYPGNVVNLSWRSRVINIAIGRLVDGNGMPLTNAVIQNVVGIAMTDDNGVFQAEVDQDTTEFEVLKGQLSCRATFDNPGTNANILPLGILECR